MTNRADCRRLMLQLERDLAAQAQFRALLTVAEATVANRRRELRNLKARVARESPGRPE
ncbi:MAG TPA: hypothetical protein VHZ73_13745 [Vicinamibacterales bacterium]|nr:hypothetical protein [Vicinamibacterales bacterium]